MNTGWNSRAKRPLESAIRPCLSTVAIAIGVFWKKHEAHFGGALRIDAAVAGAVEHQRARGAGRAVGAERDLAEQPRRAPAAGLEVDVEDLGLHLARHRRQRGQQRRALAGHDVVELEPAGADLGEIVVEPVGERGIEVADMAVGLGREKPAGAWSR